MIGFSNIYLFLGSGPKNIARLQATIDTWNKLSEFNPRNCTSGTITMEKNDFIKAFAGHEVNLI